MRRLNSRDIYHTFMFDLSAVSSKRITWFSLQHVSENGVSILRNPFNHSVKRLFPLASESHEIAPLQPKR